MSNLITRRIGAAVVATALLSSGASFAAPEPSGSWTYEPVPREQLSVVDFSSEQTTYEPARAVDTLDGDQNTFWHSQWYPKSAQAPHHLTYSLGETPIKVGQVLLTPRLSAGGSGSVKDYTVETAVGQCTDASLFNQVASGSFAEEGKLEVRTITLDEPIDATCVKISFANGWGKDAGVTIPDSSLAEFGVTRAVASTETEPTPTPSPSPTPSVEAPPAVIPAMDTWQGSEGEWKLTEKVRIVAPTAFQTQAKTLASELSIYLDPDKAGTPLTPATPGSVPIVTDGATAADIQVRIDPSMADELGVEGYRLKVGPDGVVIAAADTRGAFYGTRSLSQMLRQQDTIPAGEVTDTPLMQERGVTLCACRINIQREFIDRLIKDMADLKLNYLMLELKVKSDDPRDNLWSYYTPDDVRALVNQANAYGIDVLPIINAPGHMGAWLANHPELQLVDNAGKKHETRLNIAHPEAVKFYTDIIDSYDDVFNSKTWHMGADEYLLGTSGPSQFNALTSWAKEQFGPEATLYDAFNNFVNKVNAHVKAKGQTLRMWNDGIHDTKAVQLDKDIVIEYWNNTGIKASQFAERGYELMNASQALYWSRSALVYKVKSENLWNNNWNAGQFSDGSRLPVDAKALRGAKVSIWPDESFHQTENEVEVEVFDSLRLVSQLTWNANHKGNDGKDQTWQQFKQGVDAVGHNPQWQNVVREPLREGTYSVALTDGKRPLAADGNRVVLGSDEPQLWQVVKSPDHYYQLQHVATGQCLALREGKKDLGVVIETGAKPQLEDCVDITAVNYANGERGNPQKWQIIPAAEGYTLRNALTNQDLSTIKGTERAIDFSADPVNDKELADQSKRPAVDTVVQLPHDLTSDTWLFAAEAGALASVEPTVLTPLSLIHI